MKKKTLRKLTPIALIILGVYGLISLSALFTGMISASDDSYYSKPTCLEKPVRVVRLIPAFKLGCYLGGKEGEIYHYDQLETKP